MTTQRMSYTVAVLVGALVFLICVVGWLSFTISRDAAQDRREKVILIDRANLQDCYEIEELKKQVRDEARRDYNRLDETLRLLRIEKTPEIEARALSDLQDTLQQFHAAPCPRVRPLIGG